MFNGKTNDTVAAASVYYNGLQQRLNQARNELQAQKAGTTLAYSTVLFPDNVPEQSWNGNIDVDPTKQVAAVFLATFTRSDNQNSTPLVDFTFDYDGPTTADWVRQQGGTASGRDLKAELDDWATGDITAISDKSVSYKIEFLSEWPAGNINLSLTVRAISPVAGALKLERII